MRKKVISGNLNGRNDKKKHFLPSMILFSVLVVGTLGYYLLWSELPGATIIDAFYMTFTTIATIGFGEVHPLQTGGRIFTIIIAFAGIASLFYIFSSVMENLVTMQLLNIRGQKKMIKEINSLRDHIILVGYGRVGSLTARELLKKNKRFVVIDTNLIEDLTNRTDLLFIKGDAREDDILLSAGIETAKGIIITTGNPASTVFITISAKVLNPNIHIIARSDEESDIKKLMRAGANEVVNPYERGGVRLANLMVNPHIVKFLDESLSDEDNSFSLEKILLSENSKWVGKSLKELDLRNKAGVTILVVIRNHHPNPNPDSNFLLEGGDEIIFMGENKNLKLLESLIT